MSERKKGMHEHDRKKHLEEMRKGNEEGEGTKTIMY
jgi:hypothetical protein